MKTIFSVIFCQLEGLAIDLELGVPDSIRDPANDGAEVRVPAVLPVPDQRVYRDRNDTLLY